MNKIEYDEDKWMEQEINLSEEFVSHLDGRCFLDLDMYSERIEAYRFTKTQTGLDTLFIGCNDYWGYCYNWHDSFGKRKIKDMYCGTEILMIKEGNHLVREISPATFDEINAIVHKVIDEMETRENAFKKKVKSLDLLNKSTEL